MKTNPNDPAMERWLPVKSYEEQYEVSNLGRVRSIDRYMNNKAGNKSLKKGRILKGRMINSGSVMISLTVDRKVREVLLHRLVAEHFVPGFDPNLQVIHKDRDRSNNAASNLIIGGPLSIQNTIDESIQGNYNNTSLSKRQYYAGLAMQGLLSSDSGQGYEFVSSEAVLYADALIEALNRTEPQA